MHNQTKLPFTQDNGINISPGFDTYVGVTRHFTRKLGKPYSNCLNDLLDPINAYGVILFGYFKNLNVTNYDQKFCFTLCYQDKLIDKCGCCDIITPTIRSAKYCASIIQMECLKSFESTFALSDLNELCGYGCPQQCNDIDYNLAVSTAVYPSLKYFKILQNSHHFPFTFDRHTTNYELTEFTRKGLLKLVINYDNLFYTTMNDVPTMDANSLIGFLGGQLGE